jgi:hypothetical protein
VKLVLGVLSTLGCRKALTPTPQEQPGGLENSVGLLSDRALGLGASSWAGCP